MRLFQHTALRQWMALLFLITSTIIQVQVLYACEFMDNGPRTTCCCENQDPEGCAMPGDCGPEGDAGDSCCTVSVALPLESNLSNINESHPQDILTYHFEQPDPVFIGSQIHPSPKPGTPLFYIYANTSWYDGTDTYLLTLRFRE